MTLSEQFVVLMKRQGIDKKTLEQMTGITQPTIRKIMNDDERVSLGYYIRVAEALKATIKYTVEVKS
jgi:transcriptional regulator with XRE-family HTH domain